ncbi:PIR Superfamily Protein [Plasmodium ovale wallikeri]|uniref:PIR Superfamily Protein n=1 Tax=Plasmodium ovale wallikeri TaxID=864142 RepID=A0A1A9AHC5_PLAOA|nr:PIR Superfamily Protein [Plasmodium ovale wallikeri]SBT55599.1 PIR Superfamily Protein [Plasmodium ovale wallikeri]
MHTKDLSSDSDKFNYEDFKKTNNFLENSKFEKIYNEFNKEPTLIGHAKTYCEQIKEELSFTALYEEFRTAVCNNIYKIIGILNDWDNVTFDEFPKDGQMYCIYLKNWIYEKIENKYLLESRNIKIFQDIKDRLEKKSRCQKSFPCTFYALDWNDMIKLRKIYTFALIYYSNLHKFHKEKSIECKYLNYMGKGLKEYYDSTRNCSRKGKEDPFCNELKEFQNNYMLDDLHLTLSTEDIDYQFNGEEKARCPLEIISLENPFKLLYKERKNRWYLGDEPTYFHKSTIISASSVIGTTVGVSAFLLYLYKHTYLGSLFRTRMQNHNSLFDNMDTESHNFTLPTSEYDHKHFENNDYNMQYYSLNNS